MYKNMIFDMGNVLLEFSPYHYVEMLGLKTEEERTLIFNTVYRNWRCSYLDRGDYTEERFVEEVSAELPPEYRHHVQTLIFDWAKDVKPVPGMADLVKEVKDKGYKIYLLSNAGYRQHEYWLKIPGHEYFDGTIISCDVKAIKPERKIYEALYSTFNIKPEECLFVDDLFLNIYGAKESGMDGIVFHGDVEELRREYKKRGVL